LTLRRTAVSGSMAEHRNLPSPEIERIFSDGRTIAAAIAQGKTTPRVCWLFVIRT
jgi:hypothetical protein